MNDSAKLLSAIHCYDIIACYFQVIRTILVLSQTKKYYIAYIKATVFFRQEFTQTFIITKDPLHF